MFISQAYAQTSGSAPSGGAAFFMQVAPLLLIFVIFYFLLIRPQQRKVKEHKAMVSAVKRGDRVVTSGGLIGVITKVVDDNEVQLEIAEGRWTPRRDLVFADRQPEIANPALEQCTAQEQRYDRCGQDHIVE